MPVPQVSENQQNKVGTKNHRRASIKHSIKHFCGFLFRYPNPQFPPKKFKPQSQGFVVCLVEISGIEPLTLGCHSNARPHELYLHPIVMNVA